MKGFLQNVSDEEILFVIVGEEVSWQVLSQGIWYISGEHSLDCLLGHMLDTNLAMINIIGNVHIYSGPIDSGL